MASKKLLLRFLKLQHFEHHTSQEVCPSPPYRHPFVPIKNSLRNISNDLKEISNLISEIE